MPKATRNLSEIRLSRLTRDPALRRWFEGIEPDADAALASAGKPHLPIAGAAAQFDFA